MIRNAVPVELAERLGEFIYKFDEGLVLEKNKDLQVEFYSTRKYFRCLITKPLFKNVPNIC